MGSLSIQDLDIGVSANGIDEYQKSIKSSLLTTSKQLINDVKEVENAINSGWQGDSKERFLKNFKKTREQICDDLDKEYENLKDIIDDLRGAYYAIDDSLIKD